MKYIDAIIELPHGLVALIGEFLADPTLAQYVLVDNETKQPYGIGNGVSHIPHGLTPTEPGIVYVRMDEGLAGAMLSKTFTYVKILATCDACGESVLDGDGQVIGSQTIYEKIAGDPAILAAYGKYKTSKLYLDAGGVETDTVTATKNLQAWPTIDVDDGQGGVVTVANPDYRPVRAIGTYC